MISPDEIEQTLYIEDALRQQDQDQEHETTREIQLSDEEHPANDSKGFSELPGVKQFLAFMNPPLYAMLISVIVASVPYLRNLFLALKMVVHLFIILWPNQLLV